MYTRNDKELIVYRAGRSRNKPKNVLIMIIIIMFLSTPKHRQYIQQQNRNIFGNVNYEDALVFRTKFGHTVYFALFVSMCLFYFISFIFHLLLFFFIN